MPSIIYKATMIHYDEIGVTNKKAIVFIHGNSCSTRTWHAAFNSPLQNEYRLIAIDLPGHGKSAFADNPQEVYTVQGLVDCLVHVITDLKLSSFIMVGHSLGGHLVIESINKLKACKGIMIMGTPPVKPPLPHDLFLGDPEILANNFNAKLTFDQAKILARVRARTLEDISSLVEDILCTDGSFREILITTANGPYGTSDEIQIIENLLIPVAILHGLYHEIANISYITCLKIKNLWMNKIHMIKGAGHTLPMEQPLVFTGLLQTFSEDVFKEKD